MADSGSSPHSGVPGPVTPVAPARVKDLVCGMMVDPQKAARTVEYAGGKYYFCSMRCGERFSAEPEKFLADPGAAGMQAHRDGPLKTKNPAIAKSSPADNTSVAQETMRYTCPMDPEIVQLGPGVCPKCGMALEPMDVVAGEEQADPEYDSMRTRFWVAAAFS